MAITIILSLWFYWGKIYILVKVDINYHLARYVAIGKPQNPQVNIYPSQIKNKRTR